MADFVDCDFNETEPANESFDIFDNDEPPAKKKRGANIKYKFVEKVESCDDLKEKAKIAGVKTINTKNGTVYYECKDSSCCYKWKAKRTDEFKYLIYETECGHDHENAEQKAGLTKVMKDIVDKRMVGNERVNAGAVIQAFLNAGIKKLPTSMQINNNVAHKKRTLELTGDFNFVDIEDMVTDIKQNESELVLIYFINRRLPLMEAIAALKKWLYVCVHKNYGDPAISVKTNEWIAAHDLKHVTKVIFSGGSWYVRRSKSEWNETDYRDYLEYFCDENNDLDAGDIELFQQNIAAVTRSTLYDNEFTCNCPIGALRMRCKHVLLIQVICNHQQWPNMPALRQTINGTARNRPGRPRKHTPALSRT